MSDALAAAVGRALARIEALLDARAGGWATDRGLADAARALSRRYTEQIGAPAGVVEGDEVASPAYLALFGPRAVCATAAALAHRGAPHGTVVDAGCGSGAAALLLAEAGAARVVGIELSMRALELARALVGERLRGVCSPIERAPATPDATLVSSSFTFGELGGAPRAALAQLEALGGDDSEVLVVDAGDHPHARRLQSLREALREELREELREDLRDQPRAAPRDQLATPSARRVLAPCPHDDACPALLRERDWCHSRTQKSLPPRLAAFARAVGRDEAEMSFAFLHLSSAPRALDGRAPTDERRGVLVIGDPHKEKGRARVPVCGPGGLRFVQALKRDRAAHDALLALARGARLHQDIATGAAHGVAHLDNDGLALLPRDG